MAENLMTKAHNYYSEVKDGLLSKYVWLAMNARIKEFEGRKIKITVQEWKRQRSSKQNSFWWGVMIPAIRSWLLEQGINFDAETTHEFCVANIWKYTTVTVMPDGAIYEHRLSSTKLTTDQWETYMEISRCWFAERGLVLPLPEKEPPKYL